MTWELLLEDTEMEDAIRKELLALRIIWLRGEISDIDVEDVGSRLAILAARDREKPVHLYICSEGGQTTSALGLCDMIMRAGVPVFTYAVGRANSAALLIFAVGAQRFALANARFMWHSVYGEVEGKPDEIEIQSRECKCLQDNCHKLFLGKTRVMSEWLDNAMKSDCYFGADEALELGICDHIVV